MEQKISFVKLSGAGNDFVIIDNRRDVIPKSQADFVRKVCARRVSVGADGLLLVENSDIADFKMRYFNSDGSEAETCGNGARCIARFAYMEKIVPSSEMKFETKAGIYSAQVMDDAVKLRMGDAVGMRLDFPIKLENGLHQVSFANTGVPHVVYFVDDLENVDVVKLGRETRYHGDFQPEGTNANFIRVKDEHSLDIRTYERGVEDETLACGTGCIASAIVAAAKGKASSPVVAHTRGDYLLKIYFTLEPQGAKEVFLEGDARVIYKGYLLKDSWDY
jgi:diaminopimelate epimerase